MNGFAVVLILLAVFVVPARAAEEISPKVPVTGSPEAAASTLGSTLPRRLSGRWHTTDRMYSNLLALEEIDTTKRNAKLVYHSTQFGCTIDGLPVTITTWDGRRIEASLDKDTACFRNFKIELVRDGEAFDGRVTFNPIISGGGRPPVLLIRLTP